MKAVQANPNQVSNNTSACGNCNKTDQKLQRCAGCYFMWYCNPDCQKQHWPEHKALCQQKKYIHVVMGGAAILFNATAPKTLHYLFTNGLTTCIALMAKGKEGVALIHDPSNLTKDSIKDVIQRIGTLEFWATSINPNADREFLKIATDEQRMISDKIGGVYLGHMKKIHPIMTAIDAKAKQKKRCGSDYFKASEGWTCIDRNGEIYTQRNPKLDNSVPMQDPTLALRRCINNLNCIFYNEPTCHLQFDGKNFTPIPQLINNEEPVELSAQTSPVLAELLANYKTAKAKFEMTSDDSNALALTEPSRLTKLLECFSRETIHGQDGGT